MTACESREELLRYDGDVGSLFSQETWDCPLPTYPQAMLRSCCGPASWNYGRQRGKLGVQLPVVYPQLSFLREFIKDSGGRVVPGPWKLPGLTLSNLF